MTNLATEWGIYTSHIGRRLFVFDELPSTNTYAAEHCEPGDAVLAYHQTAGRGRFDRVWQSRPQMSLLLSVVLAPPAELRRPSILTAWAAVGLAKAIEELGEGVRPVIKWPNDILIGSKKICGILIEQRRTTVVGIGLNLSQTTDDFAAVGLPDGGPNWTVLRKPRKASFWPATTASSPESLKNRPVVKSSWRVFTLHWIACRIAAWSPQDLVTRLPNVAGAQNVIFE